MAAPANNAVLKPQQDSFYDPPAYYGKTSPGTILRTRKAPHALAAFSILPQNIASVWQVLYRTADALGNPQATVTTVIEPHNADPTKLLSYQIAEDSEYWSCQPSYILQEGSGLNGLISQAEIFFIDAALDRGWFVSIPDYEGPRSAFTAGLQAGHATLDSIRAVLASTKLTNVQANAKVALWGYSGGALATGWAAEVQPTYAPELKIIGAALGGTPADLNATVHAVNGGLFAGLIPSGFLGLSQAYPEVDHYIQSHLLPTKMHAFNRASKQCLLQDILQFAFNNMWSYFDIRERIFDDPVVIRALNENKMGKYQPKIPLFMYHAMLDEVVPYGVTKALADKYCKMGSDVEFVTDVLSEHAVLMITGAPSAIVWLANRFNGIPAQKGCSNRTTLTSALDTPLDTIKFLADDLADLLGRDIGSDPSITLPF
jgi:hypothetical protein